MSNTTLFLDAAESFVRLLARVRDEQWEQPGLGVWTVRSLAGHTARAILTVESYLGQDEPGSITIPSAEAYYNDVLEQFTDHASIEARGVEAGVWLGDNPVAQVSDALERTKALIAAQPADRVVSIGGMGILLDQYLRTRVVELIVHSIDLARAIGADYTPPVEGVATAVSLLAGTAAHKGQGVSLLMALTGRAQLPPGFTTV
ncbi:maleylpyruvate isomerase N-terminal domain-containing protein [Salinibacterium sp. SYSU T00001]|uniref:maleylpyruvate isomerase N-terminal domain-containing protein n=1 Tax=Homoserinimonas sedimenticola TaxID=2986805 RepID=UPI002235B64A|nr:maleylpyruvate isomerase N-terminal domain-containing protein [Salinibacterium sedimenticola]MCW4385542.1 maleylpyruvate isomerase N-terminal domain-containing protein [Salinibacterium sedimenticola]